MAEIKDRTFRTSRTVRVSLPLQMARKTAVRRMAAGIGERRVFEIQSSPDRNPAACEARCSDAEDRNSRGLGRNRLWRPPLGGLHESCRRDADFENPAKAGSTSWFVGNL